MIRVRIPGRGEIEWTGPDSIRVEVDDGLATRILNGTLDDRRALQAIDDVEAALRAEADRALSRAAYDGAAWGGDDPFRVAPESAGHAKLALLSIPGAELVDEDPDDESVFAEVDAIVRGYGA